MNDRSSERLVRNDPSATHERPGDLFLDNRGELLGDHGFTPDPGVVERTAGGVVFYHYTRPEHVDAILAPGGGLWARLWADYSDLFQDFSEGNLAEGFLEPLPGWLSSSPYFGDLGLEMMREYVGNVLLRIEVPTDFPGLFVADYGHVLECKHIERRGRPALHLGYDCTNGRECSKAYLNSYVPLSKYKGGHIAPVVHMIRKGAGIVVPSRYIRRGSQQPLGDE